MRPLLKRIGSSKLFSIIITFLAILIIPRIAGQLATLSAGWFGNIDLYEVYLWISLHHTYQLVFTVILIFIFNGHLGFWGFNLDNLGVSLRLFKLFVLYATGYFVIQNAVLYFLSVTPWIDFPLTAENVLGYLGFQLFLSGTHMRRTPVPWICDDFIVPFVCRQLSYR